MTAPNFIQAYNSRNSGYGFVAFGPQPHFSDVEYVRRDPTVLAALPEVQALIAAALMEAAERAGSVVWSGGIPYDEADNALLDASVAVEETIRAIITPDAMAALDAYRAREVAKALEGAAEWALDNHDCDAWAIADAIKAMIPQVKL